MKRVLLYHVVPGKFMAPDLTTVQAVGTLFGEPLSFTSQGDGAVVGEATVLAADIEAANGVIHIIDRVLMPPGVALQQGGFAGGAGPAEDDGGGGADQSDTAAFDTVFPLPDSVQNFTGEGGEGMVNYQTALTLEEVIDFYRGELSEKGLTERPLLTVTSETTFSMVFDGWGNGKALVVQGVDLGENSNVNVRFEDL
jgi:hypothetical protein